MQLHGAGVSVLGWMLLKLSASDEVDLLRKRVRVLEDRPEGSNRPSPGSALSATRQRPQQDHQQQVNTQPPTSPTLGQQLDASRASSMTSSGGDYEDALEEWPAAQDTTRLLGPDGGPDRPNGSPVSVAAPSLIPPVSQRIS